jgi:hypothetical protein
MMMTTMMFWSFVVFVFVFVLIVVSLLSLWTLLWLLRDLRITPYCLVASQSTRRSNHPIRLSNVRHLAVILEGQELEGLTALNRMLCKLHLAVHTPETLPVRELCEVRCIDLAYRAHRDKCRTMPSSGARGFSIQARDNDR